ncbi:MAG: helix-turn-helix transcriptional regulator [Candidatus Pacearchaeota archaeon]
MGFLWFGRKKKEHDDEKIAHSFESVKQDISKISAWIKHLSAKDSSHEDQIQRIYNEIMEIKQDIDGIKQFISFFDTRVASRVFRQNSTAVDKHTRVEGVQTPVYTAVQTAFLRGLTQQEKVILWILLNSEQKLSCEDIAVLLAKDRSTVRSQINNIKQKNESWISEFIEKSGKKRYYVDEKLKGILLKKMKVESKKMASRKPEGWEWGK